MDLILFGMQGSGKGTLGKFLAEKYGFKIFEMGGELRALAKKESELGKKVKSIIEAGELVSDELVMEIVEDFIENLEAGQKVLIDGIPRTLNQAKLLKNVLESNHHEYKGLLIKLNKENALKRLTTRRICRDCKAVYPAFYTKDNCEACNGELITRADDNPEAIEKRLNAFESETVPAIEFYSDKIISIDGEGSIEEVQKLATEQLDNYFS